MDAALDPQTALADALENAQKKIVFLLQHPDDLNSNRMYQLKKRLANEKLSIDAVLKTSIRSQLNDAEDGLFQISEAYKVVDRIKENLISIDSMCSNSKNHIHNFGKIQKVRPEYTNNKSH